MSKEKGKRVSHPKCTAVTVVLALRTPDMTTLTPSGRSNAANAVASIFVSLKPQGTVKMPEQSPKGTTIEPKRSLNGHRAAWLPNGTTPSSHLEAGEVHDCLDEDGVIADV